MPFATYAVEPVIPNAGSILQQMQPPLPPSPSPSGTGLTVERADTVKLPPSAPFLVKSLRIQGQTLFDTATLHALVAEAEGQSLTLAQLSELAGRITAYYRSHDYPLARALVPEQTIRDGIVTMEVVEARYGKIQLDNHSEVSDALLQASLADLQANAPIGQEALNHGLLLATDFPGVVINATLKPGEIVGTADLVVDAGAGPFVSGNAVLDNYGNRYTDRLRLSGTMNLVNLLHRGDVLNAIVLTSGSGMRYGRLSYEMHLNGQGTRIGAAHSELRYTLGDNVVALDASGTAQVDSLWVKHPFVRSENSNLYGQLQYDRKKLRDHINAGFDTDRHFDNWTATLSGDSRDALLGGAVNTWNLVWTAGQVGFDNTLAEQTDAATARTRGDFSKLKAGFSRLQRLDEKSGVYFALSGQWAGANLDASEKMAIGGPYTVRAYDMGALSGDSGYLATLEFRHQLGVAWMGQWQVIAFVDSAHLTINRNPWATGAPPNPNVVNGATLSGAGVGIHWTGPHRWTFRSYIAAPTGSAPVLASAGRSTHAWNELALSF